MSRATIFPLTFVMSCLFGSAVSTLLEGLKFLKFVPWSEYKNQIKYSLYSSYYAEACNELQDPSSRLSAWTTQLLRNVSMVVSCWRHCADLTGPGINPQTSRIDSMRLATELTTGRI